MRKGWKTRMDERQYFEEKREEREAKIAYMKMMRLKIERGLEQMEQDINFRGIHETH